MSEGQWRCCKNWIPGKGCPKHENWLKRDIVIPASITVRRERAYRKGVRTGVILGCIAGTIGHFITNWLF